MFYINEKYGNLMFLFSGFKIFPTTFRVYRVLRLNIKTSNHNDLKNKYI